MNISVRFFLGYFLIVGLAVWFVLNTLNQEIEPGLRQATEETLVDTAHVLAELAAEDMAHGRVFDGSFASALNAARKRLPHASIFGVNKETVDFRVYITDTQGIVRYDSEGIAVGADYSQWRDVSRVLRGEYGARSTRDDPTNPYSSVLYVAAPIIWEQEIIGVLTVAKPTTSIQPYITRSEERVKQAGMVLLVISGSIGLLFAFWLTWSISRLTAYAHDVSAGRKATPPTTGGKQFSDLAKALAEMREQLEGKQYVENYVQSLAHEMKSPLSAIVGAAELLTETPPEADRIRFTQSISEQSRRMQQTIERMLKLARVEQLQTPEEMTRIAPTELAKQCLEARHTLLVQRHLSTELHVESDSSCLGDTFLLQQALLNLLDNAIDFSPEGGTILIHISEQGGQLCIAVRDQGEGAPEYALPQIFERFYSLPHPSSQRKSTGLGLPFVREVARLHGGDAFFKNLPEGGAEVWIQLPISKTSRH